ncbi:MAG TPA: ABC transporter permease [Gammaproteobacteria bacterium]
MNEIRLALRGLLAGHRTGLVAMFTLALGLGGCVIVYSLLHDVFLKPLPYAQPERLVHVWERNEARNWHAASAAPANFMDWREGASAFTDMAAFSAWPNSTVLTGAEGGPRLLETGMVTGNIFDVLGARPALGRVMSWNETWQDAAPVAVLSDALWRTVFNADPEIVGRSIRLDGEAYEVIGVMPPSFFIGSRGNELWVPYRWPREAVNAAWFRRAHYIEVVGRLRGDVQPADAEAELRAIAARLREQYPELNKGMDNGLTPLHDSLTRDIADSMTVLFGAVMLVLLMACVNVSGLLLARGIGRQHQYAVQAALGASARRLLARPVVEALLISLSGAALGMLLAVAGLRGVVALWPEASRYGVDASLDLPVFAAGVLLAAVCGIATATLPAWRASRVPPVDALAAGGRGAMPSRGTARVRRTLLVLQLAGTVLLLAVALAAVNGFQRVAQREPGFAVEGRVAFRLVLPEGSYADSATRIRTQRELLRRLEAESGITAVAMASELPIADIGWSSDAAIEGRAREDYAVEVRHREVSPGFFQLMDIPMLEGDTFDPSPARDAPLQAVVNRTFAEKYFPGRSPVGARITYDRYPDENSRWRTIIGVVADFQQASLHDPVQPEIYDSLWQPDDGNPMVVIRTALGIGDVRDRVSAVLQEIDPGLPLQELTPVKTYVENSVARARLVSVVLAAFGAVAVAIALVGLYGALMFEINSRWREIGLRQALGADRGRLFGWLVGEWRGVLAAALLAGILPGVLAAPYLDHWLGEIGGGFLPALLLASGGVVLFALLAGWSGGKRAASIQPVEALRAE